MPRVGGIEARLPLLDRRFLRGQQRLRVEVLVVRLLDVEDDVLDRLIVRKSGRDQRLPRGLGGSVPSAEIEQQVGLQVWTSYYALQTAMQRVTTSRDLLRDATESVDVAMGRYRAGIGNILDLLTAQAALENARAEEVQARTDWFLSVAQLAHDTGTLTRAAASQGK